MTGGEGRARPSCQVRARATSPAFSASRGVLDESAQATVEMVAVVPVLLVLALIVFNLMRFAAATARFDRVAPDIVLAHGVSTSGAEGAGLDDGGTGVIQSELDRAMEGHDVEVEVSYADVSDEGAAAGGAAVLSLAGALRTYSCTMRYRPWPSGLSIAGVSMGAPATLEHVRDVTVDPWRSGVLV